MKNAQGAVIDATVIESACRPRKILTDIPKDREEPAEPVSYQFEDSRDHDARWLKKGNKCYFGYKGFMATDDQDGYIEKVPVTPANQSEVMEFEAVALGLEAKRIYADKGSASFENRQKLKQWKKKDGIMERASRNHPLSHWQKIKNKLISKKDSLSNRALEH